MMSETLSIGESVVRNPSGLPCPRCTPTRAEILAAAVGACGDAVRVGVGGVGCGSRPGWGGGRSAADRPADRLGAATTRTRSHRDGVGVTGAARRNAETARSPASGITGLLPCPILTITQNVNDDTEGEAR
jgi:hypothetical protein